MASPSQRPGRLPLPGLQAPAGLTGRAAAARPLQRRRQVSIQELPTSSALNHCRASRLPFTRTLNPYRGCEFACVYCYARYTHTYMGFNDPLAFETRIFAKADMPRRLQRELARTDLAGEHVALGTVTDPYQPAERRLGLTRKVLAAFRHTRGITLSITTKSDLVCRDLDILQAIGRHNRLHVNVTVVTLDAELARQLEPRAPRPDLRLSTLARLRRAGIDAGVFAMPVLPGITDGRQSLTALAAATADAGGRYLAAQPLFVRPCIEPTLYAFLRQQRPALEGRYRRAFRGRGAVTASYRRHLRQRLRTIRAAHGLLSAPFSEEGPAAKP